jgi:hypothetical protein
VRSIFQIRESWGIVGEPKTERKSLGYNAVRKNKNKKSANFSTYYVFRVIPPL